MGENSGIAWTTHTFNPWVGCQRVSPGCEHCYAEAYDKRVGGAKRPDGTKALRWGPKVARVRTQAANWRKPLAWNRAAAEAGRRDRVFCSSLADVFEDRPELVPWRHELFTLIRQTQNLDWLLLTKRPENIARLWPSGFLPPGPLTSGSITMEPWANVWLGTTVEDQQRANERIPALLAVPAVVRFLSMEPLLERVDLGKLPVVNMEPHGGLQWIIIGGESGPGARPFHLEWARDLVQQSFKAGIAPFVKQMGARPVFGDGDLPDAMWAAYDANGFDHEEIDMAAREGRLRFLDSAGGDPAEWPTDLRVRQFPRWGT